MEPTVIVYKIQYAVPLRVGLPIQRQYAVPLRAGLPIQIQYAVPLRAELPIQNKMQYDTVRNAKTTNTTLR